MAWETRTRSSTPHEHRGDFHRKKPGIYRFLYDDSRRGSSSGNKGSSPRCPDLPRPFDPVRERLPWRRMAARPPPPFPLERPDAIARSVVAHRAPTANALSQPKTPCQSASGACTGALGGRGRRARDPGIERRSTGGRWRKKTNGWKGAAACPGTRRRRAVQS